MADAIPDFLAEQREAAPVELHHLFINFEDYWERKLWHQLTDILVEFFNNGESAPQRLPFYKTFILTFADKINQLKLVTLALKAADQCKGPLIIFPCKSFADCSSLLRCERSTHVPYRDCKQSQQPKFTGRIRICYRCCGHS